RRATMRTLRAHTASVHLPDEDLAEPRLVDAKRADAAVLERECEHALRVDAVLERELREAAAVVHLERGKVGGERADVAREREDDPARVGVAQPNVVEAAGEGEPRVAQQRDRVAQRLEALDVV